MKVVQIQNVVTTVKNRVTKTPSRSHFPMQFVTHFFNVDGQLFSKYKGETFYSCH